MAYPLSWTSLASPFSSLGSYDAYRLSFDSFSEAVLLTAMPDMRATGRTDPTVIGLEQSSIMGMRALLTQAVEALSFVLLLMDYKFSDIMQACVPGLRLLSRPSRLTMSNSADAQTTCEDSWRSSATATSSPLKLEETVRANSSRRSSTSRSGSLVASTRSVRRSSSGAVRSVRLMMCCCTRSVGFGFCLG